MSREFNVGRTMTQNYSSVIGRPEPVAHPLNCNAECPYGKRAWKTLDNLCEKL